jgi:hypothetical protein
VIIAVRPSADGVFNGSAAYASRFGPSPWPSPAPVLQEGLDEPAFGVTSALPSDQFDNTDMSCLDVTLPVQRVHRRTMAGLLLDGDIALKGLGQPAARDARQHPARAMIRLRCVTQPDAAQAALLDRLGVVLPKRMRLAEHERPAIAASA